MAAKATSRRKSHVRPSLAEEDVLAIPIEDALAAPDLLGAALGDASTWLTWIATLKAAYGRSLTAAERTAFATVSGGREPPVRKVRELVVVASRRSGKGRAGAAVAVFEAALTDHSGHLAPGETGTVAIISPTLAQSRICQRYCLGFLQASPILADELSEVRADEIVLRNNSAIVTLASDYRSLRGRTLLLAIMDEAAFLRDESSSTPDIECARALAPGLATTNGQLVILSSPYRRTGLLYQRHRDFFGKDDARVLVVAGESRLFNPTLDEELIREATEADPQAALAEWRGLFRLDLSAFLEDDLIEAAVDYNRPLELPPQNDVTYFAFTDASAGRHDAFTIAICHRDGERVVVDLVRGKRPPFDPATVAGEFAALAREYGCDSVTGDNFAAEWTAGAFRDAGTNYRRSELTRSELYLNGLPAFTRGIVSIPNDDLLLRELRQLERRTTRSGKDSVDHGPSGSDDYANSLFGSLYLVLATNSADAWNAYYGELAERAQQPVEVKDRDESVRLRPARVQPPGYPPQYEQVERPEARADGARALPPGMPEALRGNSQAFAYWDTIAKGGMGQRPAHMMQAPGCAHCGAQTGTRVTDGVTVWCSIGCQTKYAQAKAARQRELELAEQRN